MSASSLTADHLWARVRASFERALLVCGGPAAIAAITNLARRSRTNIVRWLAPLENMVRKLLLVEAAQLLGPRTSSSAARRRCACLCAGADDADEDVRGPDRNAPATWVARFALAPPCDPRAVAQALHIRSLAPDPPWTVFTPAVENSTPHQGAELDPAFRLARRFEALRRVLADPLPYARRLAGMIGRLRKRFPEIAMRYAMAPQRTAGWDENDPRLGMSVTASAISAAELLPRDTS
jgi:hypothetical protein